MTWKIIAVYGCHCFFCDESFCSKFEEHYFNISRQILTILNKGWKFLKKLWCCVGGGNKVIWLYQLSWKCKLATVTCYKARYGGQFTSYNFGCTSHDVITLQIWKLQKTFQKCHFSVFWRAFKILRNCFACHIHFKHQHALPFLSNVIEFCLNPSSTQSGDNKSHAPFLWACRKHTECKYQKWSILNGLISEKYKQRKKMHCP